jgi:hypothetical protein
MTLPPYSRSREGEVHELGFGVRTALTPLDLAPREQQARALNGHVQPLQPNGQLVAHPVGDGKEREVKMPP